MTNHLHLAISAKEGFDLSNILRDFKKFTSTKITEEIKNNKRESRKKWLVREFKEAGKANPRNTCYQFWRQENKPIEMSTSKIIERVIDYIHMNPVKAEIVDEPEHYIFSSARNYCGMKGLLEIEFLD
jgi:REP element-mobilizing transposase RayT